jgi:hypothetical protein
MKGSRTMNKPMSWPEYREARDPVLAWLDGDDRPDEDTLWKEWREEHREAWIKEKLRQVRLTLALDLAGLKRLTFYPDGKGVDADDCFWSHFCEACCGLTAARLLEQIDDEYATNQMLMGAEKEEFESCSPPIARNKSDSTPKRHGLRPSASKR